MKRRAFVLLSGGMDSTTCLHQAIVDFSPRHFTEQNIINLIDEKLRGAKSSVRIDWVEAISVNYGQRHIKETEYAHAYCGMLGISHKVLDIKGILDGKGVMLADASIEIPKISYDEIKGVSPTYVPFRNGTLLSLITAHAQQWVNAQIASSAEKYEQDNIQAFETDAFTHQDAVQNATREMRDSTAIYFGAHAEDAFNWAYPDCTPEFIGSMANAIYTGSYYTTRLITPIEWASKADVVRLGEKLAVNWSGTWSCYAGDDLHCGECPTCRARRTAFRKAEVRDPTRYAA